MKKTRAVHTGINRQLFEAAHSGSAKDVKRCLSMRDCDPLARNDGGCSALMWAARKGHEDCVKLLLPVSDPLVRDHGGWSALMWAAWNGHEEFVRLLLPVSDPLAKPSLKRKLRELITKTKLRLSAKERALEGRSMSRSDPGKADEGGETSLLTEKSKSGLRSAFNRIG